MTSVVTPSTDNYHRASTDEVAIERWTNEGGALSPREITTKPEPTSVFLVLPSTTRWRNVDGLANPTGNTKPRR
jgi:hypothetical protein